MRHCFTLLTAWLVFFLHSAAQAFEEEGVLKALSNRKREEIRATNKLLVQYTYLSVQRNDEFRRRFLTLLQSQQNAGDIHTAARSLLWQGILLTQIQPEKRTQLQGLIQQGINKAIESGDEYLMAECFDHAAYNYNLFGKKEAALFLMLKSAELHQKLGDHFYQQNFWVFEQIGHLLYSIEDYAQSIRYLRLSLSMLKQQPELVRPSPLNTLGLAYQRLGKLDSAHYWLAQCAGLSRKNKDLVWEGIVTGNIGTLYFEQQQDDKALPLLWADYRTTAGAEPNNAANTLHRIALIYLRRGQTDSALKLCRLALGMMTENDAANRTYVRNTYKALVSVFRKSGRIDSAFYYNDLYQHLNDSINRGIAAVRTDMLTTKLEFEKATNKVVVLAGEKQAEKNRRNLLLLAIVLVLIIGWLYIRGQKQRHVLQQQQMLHRQQMTEAEMRNAREQLHQFTQNMVQKNELIEQLQTQVQQQSRETETALVEQSILTENDWLRFKEMFQVAHPGYLQHLQTEAPGITNAELRLAALIRLNLGNKHIASMLGIGPDAVRKTKSRLRQRLQLTADDALDDFLKTIGR
jgi:DNA-binding CsgD family transcriptional regulator